MDKNYFTIDEANTMIPALEEAFPRMIQLQGQIRHLHRRLAQRGVEVHLDSAVDDVDLDDASLIDLATLKALVGALREDLDRLQEKGALIKSIDSGLVDWYAQRDGQDIFLCWRLGESEIKWWHPVDDGFGGRRPLSDL